MEQLDKVSEILGRLLSGEALVTVGVAVEFLMRFIKSEKPRSIIYMIGIFFKKVGDIFNKLGEISDKVLPQKLKEE